jgi:hypothetical protein
VLRIKKCKSDICVARLIKTKDLVMTVCFNKGKGKGKILPIPGHKILPIPGHKIERGNRGILFL